MNIPKIIDTLNHLFTGSRFVFWHDDDSQFADVIDSLDEPNIRVIQTDTSSSLQLKIDIEQSDPTSKWLFYSQHPVPVADQDWLLDIRMRSKPFFADETSMQLEELGLHTLSLRSHLKAKAQFLRAKDRFERMKKLVLPTDTEADLDRKMMAILIRADQPDLASMLLKLFTSMDHNGNVDLNIEPRGWAELSTYGLLPSFWTLMKDELGYEVTDPSLRDLLFRILVSDLAKGLAGNLPVGLTHFLLPDRAKAASASVFLSQWRGNITHFSSYDSISTEVAQQLQLGELISGIHAEDLLNAMTFAEIEKLIIIDLRDRILTSAGSALDIVRDVFARRRDGHWANPKLASNSDTTRAMLCCYEALEAAAHFYSLKSRYSEGFSFATAVEAADLYRKELFRFDQTYRHFHRAAEQVDVHGWTLLQNLRKQVEIAYTDWFLPHLSLAWGKVIEGDNGLLSHWKLPDWTSQTDFYQSKVKTVLANPNKRVFVIISDALRFEAAEELSQIINGRNKYEASLSTLLGVLPSYTKLGMAALLPHSSLAFKEGVELSVTVDGKSTADLVARDAILAKIGGMAIHWEELTSLGKDKARERLRDANVVYIYHDRIDMLGDKAVSERQTFEAVSKTFEELNSVVGFLMGNLNASTVLITADHGFLYQESALDDADRSTLDIKAAGAIVTKKRYVIGRKLGYTDKAWCGNTSITAGMAEADSLDFWVPKGATRFHFVGGARFVHGSAMPQEVVVPLITIKFSGSDKAKTSQVTIAPLMMSTKVVNNLPRFEFIQTEPVSTKVLPRTVVLSLRDGDALISSEHTITFDSSSNSMDERKKSVILTVKNGSYDAKKDYHLVVRDADSKVELHRITLKIDLALANDF
ncbi:MAG: BREX-1 system phosphatase PglZ type A [Agitococcus sp.]|nr:BREX-1 system phosphatase PglZ type A [Agitococcus sp.]